MGSASQFKEIARGTISSAAHGVGQTVHTAGGTEDGVWLVSMSVADYAAYITEWFLSTNSGGNHYTKEVNAGSANASWSGDNLQIQQDSGTTRDFLYVVYQLETR